MMNKEDMLKKLADCVCDMEDEEIVDAVQEYLAAGYDPQEGLLNGLVEGMRRASELYEEGEYFVPELIGKYKRHYQKVHRKQLAKLLLVLWKVIHMILEKI